MSENLGATFRWDTTDAKTAAAALGREINLVESRFKASAAGLGEWQKSADGLEMRAKSLNQQIDLQQKKISALTAEYEKVAKEKGRDSAEAQKMEIRINKETEALNKNKAELKQIPGKLNELGRETDKAGEKVEATGRKMETFRGIAQGVGAVAKGVAIGLAAIGTAALAAVIGLGKVISKAAEHGDNLVELSAKTGVSIERLQELGYIGKQVGTDLETMTGSYSKLIKSMDAAKDPSSEQAKAFKALGVNVTDASGKLRDSNEVWNEALAKLGGIANETERDALALKIFGKSALELNPLIKTDADELRRLRDEAHEVGAVMSTENVEAAGRLADTLDSLKDSIQGIGYSVAGAFMPGVQLLLDGAQGYMKRLAAVVRWADGDIGKLGQGLGTLFGDIVKDIARNTPAMMKAGLGIIKSLISAVLQALPQIIPAAVEIISSLVGFLVETAPLIAAAIPQLITTLITAVIQQLPLLLQAAIEIVVALANGISQSLPTLIPAVVEVILQMVSTLVENLPLLVSAAVELILALAQGLIAALPVLINMLPTLVQQIVDALIVSAPLLFSAAIELLLGLRTGIIENLPMLLMLGPQIVIKIIESVFSKENWQKVLDIGKNLVEGIWQGIQNAAETFKENVRNFFTNIVNDVKAALKINSPSLVFAEIGSSMVEGLDFGFTKKIGRMEQRIAKAVGDLANIDVGVGVGSVPGQGSVSEHFAFYGPVVVQAGNTGQLVAALKGKRF